MTKPLHVIVEVDVIEQVSRILDETFTAHVHAAHGLLDEAQETASRATRRGALVQAAAHLLHAIHYEDRTGPVEVRRDDLRNLLDRAFIMNIEDDEATSRLRDALEGR